MTLRRTSISQNWAVHTVDIAKGVVQKYLDEHEITTGVTFGLPEVDDRYDIWRVPVRSARTHQKIGEIVVSAATGVVNPDKSTKLDFINFRLAEECEHVAAELNPRKKQDFTKVSELPNTVAFGDAEELLALLPAESIDLVFTSPPYFNVRPEYSDYVSYSDYLEKMRLIIKGAHNVLNEGRFFVLNISPVLLRRASRSESSKRIAVPFDFHRLFIEEGFDFVDDIIWEKPEGAGWATGRGRRFSADRNPLQYKPVPVTEYVLVYRKHTDKLIDWHIRKHPDQNVVKKSRISDPYQVTNIWKITPAHSKLHPAIFPDELAENVIRYYSFINDVVLDPFSGSGTTARLAHKLERRFVYMELNQTYLDNFKRSVTQWYQQKVDSIQWINTSPPQEEMLFGV